MFFDHIHDPLELELVFLSVLELLQGGFQVGVPELEELVQGVAFEGQLPLLQEEQLQLALTDQIQLCLAIQILQTLQERFIIDVWLLLVGEEALLEVVEGAHLSDGGYLFQVEFIVLEGVAGLSALESVLVEDLGGALCVDHFEAQGGALDVKDHKERLRGVDFPLLAFRMYVDDGGVELVGVFAEGEGHHDLVLLFQTLLILALVLLGLGDFGLELLDF
mmetsp:Transcript_9736/g.9473  ORF Transcript_9736/g.9473 Transcript_9736/m.9473 type:complete len:220 (-) Transcript_9736:214-873(-)